MLRDDIQGTKTYPTTIANAYELLQGYYLSGLTSTSNRNNGNQESCGDPSGAAHNDDTPRVNFVQSGDAVMLLCQEPTVRHSLIYQKKIHLSNNYPTHNGKKYAHYFMIDISGLTFNVENPVNHLILKSWILVDRCTSKSVSNNANIVTSITDCNKDNYFKLHTNGGLAIFKQMTDLKKILPLKVHFKEEHMTTTVSFSDV